MNLTPIEAGVIAEALKLVPVKRRQFGTNDVAVYCIVNGGSGTFWGRKRETLRDFILDVYPNAKQTNEAMKTPVKADEFLLVINYGGKTLQALTIAAPSEGTMN